MLLTKPSTPAALWKCLLFTLLALNGGLAFAGEAAITFTARPKAIKSGGMTQIEFAVSRETDVAVYIENAQGKVIRHLVAGVLGKNPPLPLKPNSLAQSIEWDGKADYGKPAEGGPFKVRVALELGARYDKIIKSDPTSISSIRSLAVGKDGTLYVRMSTGSGWPNGTGDVLVAMNRDGSYQRMLMPYPSNLSKEQVPGVGVLEIGGRPAPIVRQLGVRDFYGVSANIITGMAITPEGVALYPLSGIRLAAVDGQGALPWGAFAGPFLFGKSLHQAAYQRVFVALSADGKQAYLGGLGHCSQSVSAAKLDHPYAAIFKVKLPERGPAEVLFGNPDSPGNDETHLGGLSSGVATDGKGLLLAGDPANKRIVALSEKEGKFLGAIPVEAPDAIAIDPESGAVYVTRLTGAGAVELVKFGSWKNPSVLAKATFPRDGNAEAPWVMALDAGAKPPLVWMGGNGGSLLRLEDLGGKFGEAKNVNSHSIGSGCFIDVSTDHLQKEVYWRAGSYFRYSEESDKCVPYSFQALRDGNNQLVPGVDGLTYVQGWECRMERFDRAGKPVPWPATGNSVVKVFGVMSVNTSRSLGIRQDGAIFSLNVPPGGALRGNRVMQQFDAQGKAVGWGPVWHVTEMAIGPKFDAAGNIYIAEQIRPKENPFPPELKSNFYMYGSIVKFPPSGGLIDYPGSKDPPGEQYKPAPEAKTVEAVYVSRFHEKLEPVKITGAEWMHMGVSHIELAGCTCENPQFDVDEFGRVFYPDLCRFRVGVLDTRGNEILYFGGYGNAESKGPESPVLDPKTRQLRPRRPDDPKDLKSPFAEPEIAFAWLIGVGVTEKYAYMGDTLNRRLLRAKLVYTAEEKCEIK